MTWRTINDDAKSGSPVLLYGKRWRGTAGEYDEAFAAVCTWTIDTHDDQPRFVMVGVSHDAPECLDPLWWQPVYLPTAF